MNSEMFKNGGFSLSSNETTVAEGKLMRSVYGWMTLALAITGLMAYYTAHSMSLLNFIYGNSFVIWGLIIAELVIVFVMSAKIDSISFKSAGLMFGGYSLLNGLVLSSIFVVYSSSAITSAFLVTAGTFGSMALVGIFTKKDLSTMGKFLFMALVGLIIASVVNIFVRNSMLDFVVSIIGVLVFAGLTAYDSQKIKDMIQVYGSEVNEHTQKIALMGALTLYLDFINLFLYILRLFSRRN